MVTAKWLQLYSLWSKIIIRAETHIWNLLKIGNQRNEKLPKKQMFWRLSLTFHAL